MPDKPLDDDQVQTRIEQLEEEEKRLRRSESDAAEHQQDSQVIADARRLEEIRVELDQLWDYLRQRRALRAAGNDPDEASMRGPGTVEGYLN
jgi:hypothetical protein